MIAYSIGALIGIGNVPATGIPPGGSIPNVLQGTPFDLVTEDGIFSLYLNQDIILPFNPANNEQMSHSLYLVEQGVQKTIIPTSAIFNASSPGSLKINENLVMRFRVRSGSRLGHTVNNLSTVGPAFFNAHYVIE